MDLVYLTSGVFSVFIKTGLEKEIFAHKKNMMTYRELTFG